MEGEWHARFFLWEAVSRINGLERYIGNRFKTLFREVGRSERKIQLRDPYAIMQEFHDNRMEEIKVLSGFDIQKEKEFMAMAMEDFYFHIWIKKNHG